MLVRDFFSSRAARFACAALAAAVLASCAQKEQVALVNDPSTSGRESALPWNQQEKWESQGQFGGMADRMQSGSRR
jgi:outer membrane biogenesis lipoprotein LolB